MNKRMSMWGLTAGLCLIWAATALADRTHEALVTKAESAIRVGAVVPERDLQPLFDALRTATEEDQKTLIARIASIGEADGSSPAAVKRYMREQATPLFLQLGRQGKDHFLRGDALMALRGMGAPRAVLEQAAAIAEQDSSNYVKSRGEILRNYVKSMPAESPASSIKPGDPAREQQALAWLQQRKLAVSVDQLRQSAMEGQHEAVRALLDAGVDVNAGRTVSESALYSTLQSGCARHGGETDQLVKTVEVLLAGGADVSKRDDNGNTLLIPAAQSCGGRVIERLVAAGVDPNLVNGSGMTPLTLAFIMQKLEAAEMLVSKGARLNQQQAELVAGMAAEPKAKALLERASKP